MTARYALTAHHMTGMLGIVARICLGCCLAIFATSRAKPETTDLPGQDVFFTGNDVHSWCQRDKSMAIGYTAGLWDGTVRCAFILKTSQGIGGDASVEYGLERLGGFCAPRGVRRDQVTDVFCIYLRDTPETRHVQSYGRKLVTA